MLKLNELQVFGDIQIEIFPVTHCGNSMKISWLLLKAIEITLCENI
jgi:hypothetical protein